MYLRLQKSKMIDEMREMNRLVLRIFHYLSVSKILDRDAFQRALGADGRWLMRYYRGLLPKLESLMEEPLSEREKIYKALCNDMEFENHIGDGSFRFQEKELSGKQIDKVKALVMHLYERLFYKGKTQAFGKAFSHGDFKDSLLEDNQTNVCPACLGNPGNLKKMGEVDHYLPKAKYPALMFHPFNLTVVCGDCNDVRVKGEKDTLEKADITEVYFPYLRAAEDETRLSVIGDGGKFYLGMEPFHAADKTSKRMKNLDELFHLHERWTDRLYKRIEEEMSYLKTLDDVTEVESHLRDHKKEYEIKASENKYCLVDAACFEYLCGRGMGAAEEEWRRRKEEMKRLLGEGCGS